MDHNAKVQQAKQAIEDVISDKSVAPSVTQQSIADLLYILESAMDALAEDMGRVRKDAD